MKKLGAVVAAAAAVYAVTTAGNASAGSVRWTAPVLLPGGGAATEPSITVDRNGRVYVSGPNGLGSAPLVAVGDGPDAMNSPAWRSDDNGRTWKRLYPTSAGPAATPFGGGDTDVIVDRRGYVYFTDLWLGNDSIAVSTDHGATWTGSPMSHRPADDRNWLAYSEKDEALYQVYDGLDGIWISRADLGRDGDVNQALVMVNNFTVVRRPGYVSPPGRLAVDQRTGALYVCFDHNDGNLNCATSTDKGATWKLHQVPDAEHPATLPDVAVDSAGNVFVAWIQKGTLYVSESRDHGESWKTRQVAEGAVLAPAIVALGPDRVGVAWMQNDDGSFSVRYAEYGAFSKRGGALRLTIDRSIRTGGSLTRDNVGDFFRLALAPSGDLFVTYAATRPTQSTKVARLPRHAAPR